MEKEKVVNNLISLYREGKLSHAYLIDTNSVDNCFKDVLKIIKTISCPHEYNDTCSKCNICHLFNENIMPNFIVVEPDGKNIKKDAIDKLKTVFTTVPAYIKNNIYVIKFPEKMNATAYNRMLKFLEEPENNIIGFFITENKDYVANTITSRCEIIRMFYEIDKNSDAIGMDETQYNDHLTLAKDYIEYIINNYENIVWYNSTVLSTKLIDRLDVINFIRVLFHYHSNLLCNKDNFIKNKRICDILKKYLEQLNYNVNTNLLLNSLSFEIGEVYGK